MHACTPAVHSLEKRLFFLKSVQALLHTQTHKEPTAWTATVGHSFKKCHSHPKQTSAEPETVHYGRPYTTASYPLPSKHHSAFLSHIRRDTAPLLPLRVFLKALPRVMKMLAPLTGKQPHQRLARSVLVLK